MTTPEERERESRESDDTKFHERRADERDEREQLAERASERLPDADEQEDKP